MMRWKVEPKVARRTAIVDEDTVQKQVEAAVVQYFHVMDLAQGYRGHYAKDSSGGQVMDPYTGKPVRVDDSTRQTRGLPDLYLLPRTGQNGGCWLEIKRPQVVLAGKVAQTRGLRRYEQEQFHILARQCGTHIATVESAAMALSYLAYAGYDIDAYGLEPWDDACQAWYRDSKAVPHTQAHMQRKIPRRVIGGYRR